MLLKAGGGAKAVAVIDRVEIWLKTTLVGAAAGVMVEPSTRSADGTPLLPKTLTRA
jgi:hypothetical protein